MLEGILTIIISKVFLLGFIEYWKGVLLCTFEYRQNFSRFLEPCLVVFQGSTLYAHLTYEESCQAAFAKTFPDFFVTWSAPLCQIQFQMRLAVVLILQ